MKSYFKWLVSRSQFTRTLSCKFNGYTYKKKKKCKIEVVCEIRDMKKKRKKKLFGSYFSLAAMTILSSITTTGCTLQCLVNNYYKHQVSIIYKAFCPFAGTGEKGKSYVQTAIRITLGQGNGQKSTAEGRGNVCFMYDKNKNASLYTLLRIPAEKRQTSWLCTSMAEELN